ncbi:MULTISPECIES: PGDYG domain-containing protein [unclassified Undibacterium]|uniref:PGDYG domain-containing protein n=1 Tax=unclassified Undibacterium TaxID=2630295 RepID=UPI002AC89E72|nr:MULTISPECIES: PGDYG domain-containing protein [unclassified Undibacterium]MEB0139292.1 PGDYG domain-containing protein [Undibacterium sp. CCC2.1]MEB0172136.1 PGDYG domain-containing protein [Undibacterium sp. CCC1.1]MEB0176011.1 PGDYG domain-containing protein [Undibacterium sp. CCC3.4]MEB0215323.1 PGDYG domain-containing protein [Undibacterium sp. 5I2]WPX45496.1 PGDYG domain-containing protein [Undibacterium sp. CCC3.4]
MHIDLRDPLQHATPYRKRPLSYQVSFATAAGSISTLEGEVRCQPGDAIITGQNGERWPVAAAEFALRYVAREPGGAAAAGDYLARPLRVLARRLDAPLQVELEHGRGRLSAQSGDWLVQYPSHGQAIVAPDIFAKTYEPVADGAPLLIGLAGPADASCCAVLAQLHALLPASEIFLLSPADDGSLEQRRFDANLTFSAMPATPLPSVFVSIDIDPFARAAVYLLKHCSLLIAPLVPSAMSRAIAKFGAALPCWAAAGATSVLLLQDHHLYALPLPAPVLELTQVHELLRWLAASPASGQRSHQRRFSRWQLFGKMLPDFKQIGRGLLLHSEAQGQDESAQLTQVLAEQLLELNIFNTQARAQQNAAGQATALLPDALERIQLLADQLAGRHQDAWQSLLFSTTKRLAQQGGWLHGLRHRQWRSMPAEALRRATSLVGLGLLATLSFAAYTEISASCESSDVFAFIGCDTTWWQHWASALFMSVYLSALAWALLRYSNAKRAQFEQQHQDYRLLAECLRVQHCWNRLGLAASVADAVPNIDAAAANWVRNALRALHHISVVDSTRWGQTSVRAALTEFIEEQIDYHEKTLLKRRELAVNFLTARARVCLSLFMLGVAGLACNTLAETLWHQAWEGYAHHFLVLASIGALAGWAAHKKVLENFGLESEIRRGKIILAELQHAKSFISERLAHAPSDTVPDAQIRHALIGIGNVFVSDQANWHNLHRERPIEAATGG